MSSRNAKASGRRVEVTAVRRVPRNFRAQAHGTSVRGPGLGRGCGGEERRGCGVGQEEGCFVGEVVFGGEEVGRPR